MSRRAVLSALAGPLLADAGRAEPALAAPYDDVAAFLDAAVADMPDYLCGPVRVLTFLFDWSSVLVHGARFQRLDEAARRRQVEAWSRSPLGPMRDLMRLYRSLAAYALYARLDARR